jgi:hypothetical protein
VRVLVYMFGKETAQEGDGEVRQRYREQHAACSTVKCDDRLFVAASDDLVSSPGRSLPHLAFSTCSSSSVIAESVEECVLMSPFTQI